MRDKSKRIKKFFASLFLCVTCCSNSLFAAAPARTATGEELEAGQVTFEKSAEWVDVEQGIAKIDLTVKAQPVIRPVDVVLVVDKSGSMGFGSTDAHSECMNRYHWFNGKHYYSEENIGRREDKYEYLRGCTDRLDTAKSAVEKFLDIFYATDEAKQNNRAAIVSFSSNATISQGLTTDVNAMKNALSKISIGGGTNYDAAFTAVKSILDGRSNDTKSRPTYVIFLTDGEPSPKIYDGAYDGAEESQALKNNGTIIYSVGIGSSINTKYISNVSSGNGYYTTVLTADELTSIYSTIAQNVYNAGTDAKVTDVISEHFDYYEDENYKPSETPSKVDGKIVEWTKKEITDTEKTYTFYVKLKDGEEYENGMWPTNESAALNYTDTDENEQKLTAPNPELGRNKYKVEYYLEEVSEDGSDFKLEETFESNYVAVGTKATAEEKTFYGYALDKSVEGTLLQGTVEKDEELVLRLYYTKKESNVIVKYVYIDKDGNETEILGEDGNNTGYTENDYVGEETVTDKKDFYGYELQKVFVDDEEKSIPEGTDGIAVTFKEEDINVKYVYNRISKKITIIHIDKDTEEELKEVETFEKYVGEDYTTSEEKFDKYELSDIPENKVGTVANEDITVIYKYTKKQGTVIVRFVEDGTNKTLKPSIVKTGKVDEEYKTTPIDIEKYDLVKTKLPENAEGTITEEPIIVTYVYTKKQGNVVVKYVDEEGNELAKTETITKKVDEDYTTEAKEIEKYELVKDENGNDKLPENKNGKVTEETITVTYVYTKKQGTVTVRFVEEGTNKILKPSVVMTGKVDEEYKTAPIDIEKYDLVKTKLPENANGIITEEPTLVTYVYTKKQGNVVVKYIDEEGNELAESDVITKKVDEDYTTEAKEIEKYELVKDENGDDKLPENANGIITEEPTLVTYVYTKKQGNVVVKYVDEEGNELAESDVITKKIDEDYTTEAKEIDDYELVKDENGDDKLPENKDGKVTEETITVTYVYTKKPAKVTVKYVDEEGNELLDAFVIDGKAGDEYTTEREDIEGYIAAGEEPENAEGIMRDEIEVVYVYKRITGTVVVEYIDNYGNKIAKDDIITGFYGDNYEVSRKEIDGYVIYAKDPDNQKGTFIDGKIVVTYIYEKPTMINTGDINIFVYILIAIASVAGIFTSVKYVRKEENI